MKESNRRGFESFSGSGGILIVDDEDLVLSGGSGK